MFMLAVGVVIFLGICLLALFAIFLQATEQNKINYYFQTYGDSVQYSARGEVYLK